jgi:hypothetical protein
MAQPIWQREHGPDIVSEATTDANGFWIARAFSCSNPTAVVRTPKPLDSRHSACAKADALARRMFVPTWPALRQTANAFANGPRTTPPIRH